MEPTAAFTLVLIWSMPLFLISNGEIEEYHVPTPAVRCEYKKSTTPPFGLEDIIYEFNGTSLSACLYFCYSSRKCKRVFYGDHQKQCIMLSGYINTNKDPKEGLSFTKETLGSINCTEFDDDSRIIGEQTLRNKRGYSTYMTNFIVILAEECCIKFANDTTFAEHVVGDRAHWAGVGSNKNCLHMCRLYPHEMNRKCYAYAYNYNTASCYLFLDVSQSVMQDDSYLVPKPGWELHFDIRCGDNITCPLSTVKSSQTGYTKTPTPIPEKTSFQPSKETIPRATSTSEIQYSMETPEEENIETLEYIIPDTLPAQKEITPSIVEAPETTGHKKFESPGSAFFENTPASPGLQTTQRLNTRVQQTTPKANQTVPPLGTEAIFATPEQTLRLEATKEPIRQRSSSGATPTFLEIEHSEIGSRPSELGEISSPTVTQKQKPGIKIPLISTVSARTTMHPMCPACPTCPPCKSCKEAHPSRPDIKLPAHALCLPNPCHNGGTCNYKFNTYSCDCPIAFAGKNCEKRLKDCGEIKENFPAATSGTYIIELSDKRIVTVYCDMDTLGGGWTVFQKRQDGSVDFNRDWKSYEEGFGHATGEHWLGNKNLHHLTWNSDVELLIEVKEANGVQDCFLSARYADFKVGTSSYHYVLLLGKFLGGLAGDALSTQNTMKFSTRDHGIGSCPTGVSSGWWHKGCNPNLNGKYMQTEGPCTDANKYSHIGYVSAHGAQYAFPYVEMKFRSQTFKMKLDQNKWCSEISCKIKCNGDSKCSAPSFEPAKLTTSTTTTTTTRSTTTTSPITSTTTTFPIKCDAKIEWGIKFDSDNIKSKKGVKTVGECCQLCKTTDGCRAFTMHWSMSRQKDGTCQLKHGTKERTELPSNKNSVVSGTMPVCDSGWNHFAGPRGDMCYKINNNTNMSANTARALCGKEGATMVTIKNEEENDFVRSILKPYKHRFWIGLRDQQKEDMWVWEDGETFNHFWVYVVASCMHADGQSSYFRTFDHYSDPLEPSGGISDNCAHMGPPYFVYIQDENCDAAKFYAACQRILNAGPCSAAPCLNGGICSDIPGGGYACSCVSGYHGEKCENKTPDTVWSDEVSTDCFTACNVIGYAAFMIDKDSHTSPMYICAAHTDGYRGGWNIHGQRGCNMDSYGPFTTYRCLCQSDALNWTTSSKGIDCTQSCKSHHMFPVISGNHIKAKPKHYELGEFDICYGKSKQGIKVPGWNLIGYKNTKCNVMRLSKSRLDRYDHDKFCLCRGNCTYQMSKNQKGVEAYKVVKSVLSKEACCLSCTGDTRCKVFIWLGPGASVANSCHLLSDVPLSFYHDNRAVVGYVGGKASPK